MQYMLRTLLLASLLCSIMTAAEESRFYAGLDLVTSNSTTTTELLNISSDRENDSSGFKLKFGADVGDAWRVQGYLQHERYDHPIFDSRNDKLNELGVEVVKGFNSDSVIMPFIQAGFGYGWMDINGYSKDVINEATLRVGGGLFYRFTSSLEGVAGIDFQFRGWDDVDLLGVTIETHEKAARLYLGANFYF